MLKQCYDSHLSARGLTLRTFYSIFSEATDSLSESELSLGMTNFPRSSSEAGEDAPLRPRRRPLFLWYGESHSPLPPLRPAPPHMWRGHGCPRTWCPKGSTGGDPPGPPSRGSSFSCVTFSLAPYTASRLAFILAEPTGDLRTVGRACSSSWPS